LALVKICLMAGMKLLFQLSQRNFFVKTIGRNFGKWPTTNHALVWWN